MWSRSLEVGSRGKSQPFRKWTARHFADKFKDRFGHWPTDYSALAAASALLAQEITATPVVSLAGYKPRSESFWGPIKLAANGTNELARWRWVQFIDGEEEVIDDVDTDSSTRSYHFLGDGLGVTIHSLAVPLQPWR